MLLSEKQSEIVNFSEGPLLVTAGAGSGKTRVLTERICILAEKTRRRILAITFTNKACEEIKSRVETKDYDLLEKVFISTFHGFCMQVLESHVNAMGWQSMPQLFTDEDVRQVITSAICEEPSLADIYINQDLKAKTRMIYNARDIISQIKREVILDDELETRINDITTIKIYRAYCDYMNNLHAIDYDDLLLDAYRLFLFNSKIASDYRREFEYICVDEAQDMNKAQYQLLRILTGDSYRNIMLVGDAKQSIYAFNGSSSCYMMDDFVRDYAPVTKIELFENYRSAKAILDIAGKIMPDAPVEEYVKLEGVCEEIEYDDPKSEADGVIKKIKELIANKSVKDIEGHLNYSDISVLARNKYVLSVVENALKEESIPYYYKNTSGNIEFTSSSANVFILALMVKLNERDTLHLGQLNNLLNLKCSTLTELFEAVDKDIFSLIIQNVIDMDMECNNFRKSIRTIIDFIKLQSSDVQMDQQEWIVAYEEFTEINKQWLRYARSVSNPNLAAFRNAMTLGQTSVPKTEESVALATVHTMKGQQSTVIFLIGMDDGTFPDYRAKKMGDKSLEMQQERNNLYVAVTRAKRHLYISYPQKRQMPWGDFSRRCRSSLLPKTCKTNQ